MDDEENSTRQFGAILAAICALSVLSAATAERIGDALRAEDAGAQFGVRHEAAAEPARTVADDTAAEPATGRDGGASADQDRLWLSMALPPE